MLISLCACTTQVEDAPQVAASDQATDFDESLLPDEFNAEYTYFLDGQQVSEDPSISDSTLNVIVVLDSPMVEIQAFSTIEGYWDFGVNNNLALRELDSAAAHLNHYAHQSGAVRITEETGEIPQFYLDYESEYLGFDEARKTNFIGPPIPILFEIEDACIGTNGNDRVVFGTIPWMSGFNNRTSSFIHRDIAATVILYDRPWYSRRMRTFWWRWGWIQVPLCRVTPGVDNRTSSIITVSPL